MTITEIEEKVKAGTTPTFTEYQQANGILNEENFNYIVDLYDRSAKREREANKSTLDALKKSVVDGAVPTFDEYKARDGELDFADFQKVVAGVEIDGLKASGVITEPPKMSRTAWQALPLLEQAAYIQNGGTLYDLEGPRKPEEDKVKGADGSFMPANKWRALPLSEQRAFVVGN